MPHIRPPASRKAAGDAAEPRTLNGPLGLVLNLDERSVTRGNLGPVRFEGKRLAWELFVELCRGQTRTYRRMPELRQAWNPLGIHEALEGSKRAVEVHIAQARKIVRPLGVRILRAVPELGYRLADTSEP
jgi:DNA-binding response OmpR family regulator